MEVVKTSPEGSFNTLLTRNVPHLLENIFFSLDYKSFKACMEVNKTWRALLSTPSYQEEMEKMLREKMKNEEELYEASQRGNVEEVRRLIFNLKTDPNFVARTDLTMFNGHGSMVQGSTPLIEAVLKGCIDLFRYRDVVKVLLDGGADPNKAHGGMNPLHWAADRHFNMVEVLLDAGADINSVDYKGMTPLHLAAGFGCHEVVKILLDRGAALNMVDYKYGNTPLHEALVYGQGCEVRFIFSPKPIRVVNALLEGGADPYIPDKDGMTPMGVMEERISRFKRMLKKIGPRSVERNYERRILKERYDQLKGIIWKY